jgi:FkbM family methyltransferase
MAGAKFQAECEPGTNRSRETSERDWSIMPPTGRTPPSAGIPHSLPFGGGGFAVFDSADAQLINEARLDHLASLKIPVEGKSVLDVSCGVGHLSGFFVERGARVVCVDARPENIARLHSLYPGREAHVANVEFDRLSELGRFGIVFCYGLLYHIENPIAALRNIASCCGELLLLETVATDYPRPIYQLEDEPPATKNQAVSGFGCRPSPAFVAMALSRMGFSFVYTSDTRPNQPDFDFEWTGSGESSRDGKNLRCIFVASRTKLSNPHLTLLLEAPESLIPANDRASLLHPAPDQIWLDVGAHDVEKKLAAARQNPALRVYAFEPNLAAASRLMGVLANYVVLPVAVAEENGSAPFHLNRYEGASSLLPFAPEGLARWIGGGELSVTATVTVPTMRLDTFLDGAGIGKVDYLKIDAQGADLAVIRSAGERLKDIDRISLEVQTAPFELYRGASRKEDVLRFLTSSGFRLAETEAQSFDQQENLTFIRAA